MDNLSFNIMNTDFYIEISGETNLDWKANVEEWLSYVAKQWSRFEQDNELDMLNQLKIGDTLQLSSALYDCLIRADHYYTLTNNLFSPYLKLHLERHGYNQSFPFRDTKLKSIPMPKSDGKPFHFFDNRQVLKMDDQQVDLGGFAKGYAVEKIAQWLQSEISPAYGMVDGGGDMKMWSAGEKIWTLGIAHPFNPDQEIQYIRMKNGAVATSNRVFRSWRQEGKNKHHLLNGQTGEVIDSPVLQTTVVTQSLCTAEVAAKLSFLLNEHDLQQWFEKQNLPCACFIVKDDESSYWLKGGEKFDVS